MAEKEPTAEFTERTAAAPLLDAASIEQYRSLALTLEQAEPKGKSRVIVVTSALPNEGKTLTATNLALTLSGSYARRVLLIDGDLRRPHLHAVFNTAGAQSSKTTGEEGLPLQVTLGLGFVRLSPTLVILAADGRPMSDPVKRLNSREMKGLLDWARARFDWVIVDSPPAVLVPDANILGQLADGVLLVVWTATTPLEAALRAVSTIGRERILGVVLNRVPADTPESAMKYYKAYAPYGPHSAR